MEADKLIKELKKLNLSEYPENEIRRLLNEIGHIGSIVVTLHREKSVMRARPNYNGERFHNKADFSFKPQKYS